MPSRAVTVGVDCVAQVQKEVRLLRANGAHDGKWFVAFSRIGAEAKRHFGFILRVRRGDKAGDRPRSFAGHRGAVVITRCHLQFIEGNFRRKIGIRLYRKRSGRRELLETGIATVLQGDLAPWFGAEPN